MARPEAPLGIYRRLIWAEQGPGTRWKNMERLRLYLITDRGRFPQGKFLSAVSAALEGGVKALQLREKDLAPADLLALANRLRPLTSKHGALLFINDRADIAAMSGADGVHLTEQSVSAKDVKRAFPRLWVGVSTHDLKGARRAETDGADFITFSPVFETPSKAAYGPPQGLDNLARVARAVNIPVLALGGVGRGEVKSVLDHGAYGVAVISGIWDSVNIRNEAFEYMRFFAGET
jgi:thiamine-phosphate pyrophosphorylase